ncbi:PEP-CTERM motif protein [Opitutaceae bacterium TAV5]|nr:PEP-CTERM motif protein [Opitutaceae bacterium TAV5]
MKPYLQNSHPVPSRLAATALTAFLVAVALPAINALSISQSATAPDTNVIASSGSTTPHASANVQYNRSANSDRFGGFLFSLAGAADLGAVTVYVHSYGYDTAKNPNPETTAAFSVSIVAFNSEISDEGSHTIGEPGASWTTPPAAPTLYSTVYSETVTMPSSLVAEQFLTFTFSNSVSLAAGTTYGIVFHWLDSTAGNSINIRSAGTASSARNFRTTWARSSGVVTQYDTTVEAATTRESLFILQSATSNIPEPATNAALLGVAALVGIVACRFRRRSS